jgi:tetratricopeptide (TPR) repeat protein
VSARSITCEACGAKFNEKRLRCPRCRRIVTTTDPVAAAASSRRMVRAAGGVAGIFLLAVTVLWLTGEEAPAARTPSTSGAATKPSTAVRPAAGPPVRTDHVPGAAFLDPSGAAALAYGDGDFQTSLARFQDAVTRNPNDAESLSNLGQVLVKLGRAEEALVHLQRATTLNPDRWAYRFNYARALGVLGRWTEAVDSYKQAQRLFPDDYVTAFNYGMALYKAGDYSASVEQYRRAIELNPEDASFRVALANSYERLQDRAGAAAAYAEYLRLSPDSPDVDKVRARIAVLSGAPVPAPLAAEPKGGVE